MSPEATHPPQFQADLITLHLILSTSGRDPLTPFFRWRNQSSEGLRVLPRAKQLLSGRSWIWTQVSLIAKNSQCMESVQMPGCRGGQVLWPHVCSVSPEPLLFFEPWPWPRTPPHSPSLAAHRVSSLSLYRLSLLDPRTGPDSGGLGYRARTCLAP